ncbi:MAG: YbaB/EbfC family nucleoid-associated protein [Rhodospirillum sp.]|nr:YbaB/EbfC family nucleoid-associated protein [Rhodospirillum sp.]MCF8488922.1 YbaB/EbfC family nucleoid-associated protein [Rhodospirillum sp.]MCF8498978.1 YbaB/EbfC family nucleoid-associated protein [Rhodospirillum sp.]
MKNIGQMLKQAQQIQTRMAEVQEELKALEVTGQSAAGMCRVTLNGKGDVRGIKIDKSLVDPEDVEVLEDLIVAAFNDAKGKVDEASKEKMAEVTGGLKLPPGLNLPF